MTYSPLQPQDNKLKQMTSVTACPVLEVDLKHTARKGLYAYFGSRKPGFNDLAGKKHDKPAARKTFDFLNTWRKNYQISFCLLRTITFETVDKIPIMADGEPAFPGRRIYVSLKGHPDMVIKRRHVP